MGKVVKKRKTSTRKKPAAKEVAVRKVICTHCEKTAEVALKAMSVFCPHCKKRLIVEDLKVKGYKGAKELSTCGNVTVFKSATVAAPVKAQNLEVKGKVWGNILVRDRVTIAKSAQIKGDVCAPRLIVQEGAELRGSFRIGTSE